MKLRLEGGDKIIHKGRAFIVSKKSALNASPVLATGEEETEEDIVQGEQKSDLAQGIDKGVVLGFIQKGIDKLETHENKLLMEGMFDGQDDLDLVEEQRGEHYKTANYAATNVHIMDLKSLYKKVKNLA